MNTSGSRLLLSLLAIFLVYAGVSDAVDADAAREAGAGTDAEAPSALKGDKPEKKEEEDYLDWPISLDLDAEDGEVLVDKRKWKSAEFTGSGKIWIEKDTIFLGTGNDMTGIVWDGPLARMNYEITLEGKRVEGGDFWCGLTFPYGEDPCSLILGGWGGTLVGISSLDYLDAYNNETARFKKFEDDQWYKVRLRVTDERIEAWIDNNQFVDVKTEGRKIGIRWEMERCVPLGIATWRTSGAIRNFEYRKLPGDTAPAEEKESEQ